MDKEQITQLIGEYSGRVMYQNPKWAFVASDASCWLADEVWKLIQTENAQLHKQLANMIEGRRESEYSLLMASSEQDKLLKQLAEKTCRALAKDYYCIPKWCRMPPMSHYDGMAGCWGISGGHVLVAGEKHCETCEYHDQS